MADAGAHVAPPPAAQSAGGGAPKFKRSLRNYLIDKSLQGRYILFVTLLSTVVTGGLGYLVWFQATFATRKIEEALSSGPFAGDLDLRKQVMATLSQADQGQLFVMLAAGMGLIAVLSLYLVIMTHKVAGPLYKMGLYFDKIRDGALPVVYDLRKGDQLQDVFKHFKDMNDACRARAKADIDTYDKFLTACDKAGAGGNGELGHKLDELRTLKKTREGSLS